jgi:hypothetical protein
MGFPAKGNDLKSSGEMSLKLEWKALNTEYSGGLRRNHRFDGRLKEGRKKLQIGGSDDSST